MTDAAQRVENVKQYYGKTVQATKDLKTNACCTTESLPAYIRQILKNIDQEILTKFYGCGSPIPPALEGCVVLDIGCGTGRDAYAVSKLVGPDGRVIGMDMTDEQLEFANRHIDSQMKKFGFIAHNIEFKKGYAEDLSHLGIEDGSIDVVISNCVINLCSDKRKVFSEIFRVLKPGGELYFSDVFTKQRVPEYLHSDPVLVGECLAGAMYVEDFRRILREIKCFDHRVVSQKAVTIDNPEIETKIGMIEFESMTVRAFKLDILEDCCEDYGQSAVYLGTIPECPHRFILDEYHIFITGKPMLICGNTASMLEETRFGRHFKITGDRSRHFGKFPCSTELALGEKQNSNSSCC
ncbi:MAG: methyltransferase type 11 [Planctomycetes bacterium GWF2_50_10]|nr:MAG: methyltransferase type 11 [Planctomycetes bacterium GWF2_50_10]